MILLRATKGERAVFNYSFLRPGKKTRIPVGKGDRNKRMKQKTKSGNFFKIIIDIFIVIKNKCLCIMAL